MDSRELRSRVQDLYQDELQYALARDEQVDLARCRLKASMRIGREMEGQDLSAVWLGYVEGIARRAERGFEVDPSTGQLRLDGALRVGDLTFVPAAKARAKDWMQLDQRREAKFQDHREKRDQERDAIRTIVDRLRAHGGDPTTIEACPDLFPAGDQVAA